MFTRTSILGALLALFCSPLFAMEMEVEGDSKRAADSSSAPNQPSPAKSNIFREKIVVFAKQIDAIEQNDIESFIEKCQEITAFVSDHEYDDCYADEDERQYMKEVLLLDSILDRWRWIEETSDQEIKLCNIVQSFINRGITPDLGYVILTQSHLLFDLAMKSYNDKQDQLIEGLSIACSYRDAEFTKKCVALGANVNEPTQRPFQEGFTAYQPDPDIIPWLKTMLALGVNIDQKNSAIAAWIGNTDKLYSDETFTNVTKLMIKLFLLISATDDHTELKKHLEDEISTWNRRIVYLNHQFSWKQALEFYKTNLLPLMNMTRQEIYASLDPADSSDKPQQRDFHRLMLSRYNKTQSFDDAMTLYELCNEPRGVIDYFNAQFHDLNNQIITPKLRSDLLNNPNCLKHVFNFRFPLFSANHAKAIKVADGKDAKTAAFLKSMNSRTRPIRTPSESSSSSSSNSSSSSSSSSQSSDGDRKRAAQLAALQAEADSFLNLSSDMLEQEDSHPSSSSSSSSSSMSQAMDTSEDSQAAQDDGLAHPSPKKKQRVEGQKK